MNVLIRIVITAALVMLLAHLLPGVEVLDFLNAVLVAIVLGLLNLFIKPLLVLFTLPLTILTFGLFLLVINALIIQFSSYIVGGFRVESFGYALLFSIILSVSQSIVYKLTGGE